MEALGQIGKNSIAIHVITTVPHKTSPKGHEKTYSLCTDNINIDRVRLPLLGATFFADILNFLYFYCHVLNSVRKSRYDVVAVTTSRLMTGFLGACISRMTNTPLYLDIRDIFYESFRDVFRSAAFIPIAHCIRKIESFTYATAHTMNVVSEGFVPYVRQFNVKRLTVRTNGIDDEFLNIDYSNGGKRKNKRTILYAGNIGLGQCLHKIIPQLADHLRDEFDFTVIGDGNQKKLLVQDIVRLGLKNVTILESVPRSELINHYRTADILFLHLDRLPAFRRVIPSKIFEYGTTAKPIMAGVSGYAEKFITLNIPNAVVFEPCDARDAIKVLSNISYKEIDVALFSRKFSRRNIAHSIAQDIINIGENSSHTTLTK